MSSIYIKERGANLKQKLRHIFHEAYLTLNCLAGQSGRTQNQSKLSTVSKAFFKSINTAPT